MTVVGLSGFAQSGKTTAALYLKRSTAFAESASLNRCGRCWPCC